MGEYMKIDFLQVRDGRIVNESGAEVRLRGTCLGGWMNMENFINGYPGSEHELRWVAAEILGPAKAKFFFDRLLDHFLTEDDIVFMKRAGVNVLRLPLNYRHFEDDLRSAEYNASGFKRLEEAVSLCEKHGIYVIFDLHAVQGWQNPDWHSDNASRHSLFWRHAHFQDRWIRLWRELAHHYKGESVIAGYNVMNEPVTGNPRGFYDSNYATDWDMINRLYRSVVKSIRSVDSKHIVFLEGDLYSTRFEGFDEPFDDNLVYSCHHYTSQGFGPGAYPNEEQGWNRERQKRFFEKQQGIQFSRRHSVPLWVGEFGSVYNGPSEEVPDRLRALDDEISVFEETGVHWTTWTYKDVGVMGWVTLDPECEYLERIKEVLSAKRLLRCDHWQEWLPETKAGKKAAELADLLEEVIADRNIETKLNRKYFSQTVFSGYAAALLQPEYVKCFKNLFEIELDRVLSGFAFKNCRVNEGIGSIIRKYTSGEA